jgi:hypothetical protein
MISAGTVFGMLTVTEKMGLSPRRKQLYKCRCECGTEVVVEGANLPRSGPKRSCGCLRGTPGSPRGVLRCATAARHGHTKGGKWSGTYRSWVAMVQRCTYLAHPKYHLYGGRGISVCDRWLGSFENFLADVGERPAGKTLDRYPDQNGNYAPVNCRWATPKEQAANSRRSFKFQEIRV